MVFLQNAFRDFLEVTLAQGDEHGTVHQRGTLLRVSNGDVIGYDDSGIVLHLSDRVIADIALRLGLASSTTTQITEAGEPQNSTAVAAKRPDPCDYGLENIDLWNLYEDEDWLHFTGNLPGKQGVSGFRRLKEGGAIIADSPGALHGILGLGGSRAALASQEKSAFPQHILAPSDDIGAVGHSGIETARDCSALEHLREMTHEAYMAQSLLFWQLEKTAALPLFVTRIETDQATSINALAQGAAFTNMLIAVENTVRAAKRAGKRAKMSAFILDFALEDQSSSALEYRDGVLRLISRVNEALLTRGLSRPRYLARFDTPMTGATRPEIIEGQWELSWNHGDLPLTYSAPSYMFAFDRFERATSLARQEMAQMSALALSDVDWHCPTLMLAEKMASDPKKIRVVTKSMGPLVLDSADPLGAGAGAGFRLIGAQNTAQLSTVSIDPEDPKSLIIEFTDEPLGDQLQLAYAFGASPREGEYPSNCGALRDDWGHKSQTGRTLHRWALPAILPVHWGSVDDD